MDIIDRHETAQLTSRANQVAALLLLVALFFFAVFLWQMWLRERNYLIQELNATLRFAGSFCDGYFERITKNQQRIAEELAANERTISGDQAIAILRSYRGANPDQLGFSLMTPDGHIVADTTGSPKGENPTLFQRIITNTQEIQTPLGEQEKLQFNIPWDETSSSMLTIPFHYRIRDRAGETKYVIRSRLRLTLLERYWEAASLSPQFAIGFVEHSGLLISNYQTKTSRPINTSSRIQVAHHLTAHLREQGPQSSGWFMANIKVTGADELIVYRGLSKTPLTMFVSIPLSTLWSNWWERVTVPIVLGIAFVLSSIGAYGFFVRHQRAKWLFAYKQEQLRHVARETVNAQEQERERLSHELHDEVGQSLTALKVTLTRATSRLTDQSRLQSLLTASLKMVDGMMDEVRGIAHQLYPPELKKSGLSAALDSLHRGAAKPLFSKATLSENVCGKRFSAALELCCFRVAQESLTNCLRHSNATEIDISLSYDINHLTLSIRDNGCGFNPEQSFAPARWPQGLGIMGMRERVLANNGQFSIASAEGMGTEVLARFTINEEMT